MLQCCVLRFCVDRAVNFVQPQTWSVFRTLHNSSKRNQTNNPMNVFDKNTKILQKERAAVAADVENFDYVKAEVGGRLCDRIYDIKRDFNNVVDLGCGRGYVSKGISSDNVKELICCDVSQVIADQANCLDENVSLKRIIVDEEALSDAIEPASVDLVISNLTLHWVNDLPRCFDEIMKILKNDGVFMGAIFGGDTLYELR